MKNIPEILESDYKIDPHKKRACQRLEITQPIKANFNQAFREYENEVFNFLLAKRSVLKIREIYQFKNCIIDGEIVTECDQVVPIEIKYRMNWLKACQAEWQLARFANSHNHDAVISNGIVFF